MNFVLKEYDDGKPILNYVIRNLTNQLFGEKLPY